ncbi:unnamed protein product [Leptidea sinapis]|uniref:Uncharacterized protein n=1 Tax=Leptidea sinapis TaxID=189913 RepID=A0A5E4QRB7_9NEOP|nr:unnamed protein product [Leptidea sinapis]
MVSVSEPRRYDLEEESKKMYGHDVRSVLDKFRRTPDYVTILHQEIAALYDHMLINEIQNRYYFNNKLKEKVFTVVTGNLTEAPSAGAKLRTEGVTYTSLVGPHRQPVVRQHTHNMSAVERLQTYGKLSSLLTPEKRNHMMDLGFEYAGYAIHGLIKSMEPSGKSLSTLNPFVGDNAKTSFHDHNHHQVSTRTVIEQSGDDEASTPDVRNARGHRGYKNH